MTRVALRKAVDGQLIISTFSRTTSGGAMRGVENHGIRALSHRLRKYVCWEGNVVMPILYVSIDVSH